MFEPTTLTLRLRRRSETGATEVRLSGVAPSVPPPRTICRLLAILAAWNQGPVRVVLSVDGTNEDTEWALRWDDGLQWLGLHQVDLHLEVRGFPGTMLVGHER